AHRGRLASPRRARHRDLLRELAPPPRRPPAARPDRQTKRLLAQTAEKGPSASLAPSAARSTYRKYASRAAVGRRLASGPFGAGCDRGERLRPDENLRVVLGRTEVDEGLGDAVETDLAGNERRGGNLCLGEVTQGGRELVRRIAEHELQVELLADAEHGVDGVRLHAHADDHDARAARRGGHEL